MYLWIPLDALPEIYSSSITARLYAVASRVIGPPTSYPEYIHPHGAHNYVSSAPKFWTLGFFLRLLWIVAERQAHYLDIDNLRSFERGRMACIGWSLDRTSCSKCWNSWPSWCSVHEYCSWGDMLWAGARTHEGWLLKQLMDWETGSAIALDILEVGICVWLHQFYALSPDVQVERLASRSVIITVQRLEA